MAAANARNIEATFKLSPEAAKSLARVLKGAPGREDRVDIALDAANAALNGHGVEAIRGDYQVDSYYRDIVALYVNMGDTYDATILYETEPERFTITAWGDWVEHNQRKYRIE
jgi:hypothetical protein